MQVPFFPPIGRGDIHSIVSLALYEMGLSERFLLGLFLATGGSPTLDERGQWDCKQMSVCEWIWICRTIYLPLDSISIGYVRHTHKAWIGRAIQAGRYVLPNTKAVERLFREYLHDQKLSARRERRHYGPPLSLRMKQSHYRAAMRRRRRRKRNLAKLLQLRKIISIQHKLSIAGGFWTNASVDSKMVPAGLKRSPLFKDFQTITKRSVFIDWSALQTARQEPRSKEFIVRPDTFGIANEIGSE